MKSSITESRRRLKRRVIRLTSTTQGRQMLGRNLHLARRAARSTRNHARTTPESEVQSQLGYIQVWLRSGLQADAGPVASRKLRFGPFQPRTKSIFSDTCRARN